MSNEENKKGHGFVKWLIVIGAGIAVGLIIAVIFLDIKTGSNEIKSILKSDLFNELDSNSSNNDQATKAENISSSMKVSSSDVSEIVDNVLPSVVSIDCIVQSSYSYDDLFGFDFGFDFGLPQQTYEAKTSGTGFIIGQNGDELLLATNNHVVDGANSISVEFIDGKKADAVVKGTDSFYDVAVISVDMKKIDTETLNKIKIATIGNSDTVKVGEMSIAIGNALGYGQSVTVGYISALDRSVNTQDNRVMELMQTDTIINHGNSGGPLLNIYGEVIGITSAKYGSSSNGKAEGMGFAIPITKVVPIINELMNRVELKESEIGYLGIVGKEVNDSYARAFNMPKGLYIYEVQKNSAADIGGLKSGDIITSINDRNLSTMDELKNILSYKKYGTEIDVKYSTLVNGEYVEKTVKVKLGKKSTFDRGGSN